MAEHITLSLGGKNYKVRPLTLGQLEELHVGLITPPPTDPQEAVRDQYRRNLEVIAIALSVDHKDMTAEQLRAMPIWTVKQFYDAAHAVLRFSGLVDEKATTSGEDTAAA